MKKLFYIFVVSIFFIGCNAEKKVTRYKEVYTERPAVVMIVPCIDNTERKSNQYKKDREFNKTLDMTTRYFNHSMHMPLVKKGYYVVQYFTTEEILKNNPGFSLQTLADTTTNLSVLDSLYGVDAVLITTLHRWIEKNAEWSIMVEYKLKSTKTNKIIFHAKIKGKKQVPINARGYMAMSTADLNAAKKLNMDPLVAQRVILLNKLSDYVIKNLPDGKLGRSFDRDLNKTAIPECFEYTNDENGSIGIRKMEIEEFENDCYVR